ncbi:DUF368 domain-containing protein [Halegenticoccus tardaugens]|uniref:DUF368 domain-containing protein n=1 Tax=Halegenticoccus tardaugens TaxID=2071624 RepID=UPI001E3B51C3|nr:DUF368 domain-containing protein [Halegenticoccus tardaugens]
MAGDVRTGLRADGVRTWIVVYLKGFCMGAADAVPGVSGGTIALITGIYERLIGAVTAIGPERVLRVVKGVKPSERPDARDAFFEMDGLFLLVLGTGIFTAVATITRALEFTLEHYTVETFGFFFGLIAASALVLYGEVRLDTPGRVAAAIAGFVLAFLISGEAAGNLGGSYLVVLVAGAIAVSAMILPGISGSLLLILLGQYERMVTTLSVFIDSVLAVLTGGDVGRVVEPGIVVVTFVTGAVIGLFTISHVVRWALEHYREATLVFLVSLIVGALRAPIVEVSKEAAWTTEVVLAFAAAGVVGAVAVVLVDRYAADIEY